MTLNWPESISLTADVVTLLGIPILIAGTVALFFQLRADRQLKGVGEDCLNFFDVDRKVTVNVVPYKATPAIPRVGETVYLPGETEGEMGWGTGQYQVVGVEFRYREDRASGRPAAALPLAIEISVRRLFDFTG
jgi:hypothetical protein